MATSPTLQVRPAEDRDAEAISRLFDVLGHPLDPAGVRDRIAAFARAADHCYLVGEIAGEVVAFVTAHTAESPHHPGRYGIISAMAISEAHQRKGLGRQLLAGVEGWFREQGCFYVRVTSAAHRTDTAHRFYPSLGYTQTGVRFDKPLD
ncbi:MAG: GNAT family N-acetyltransferase [Armatimonadetes bacterium]|nr:GNAT family N-acetyltransferase [Armatimonadota bacterium]